MSRYTPGRSRKVDTTVKREGRPVEVDPRNPITWSLDDPLLWYHEKIYRKEFSLPPHAPIPGHPALKVNPPKKANASKDAFARLYRGQSVRKVVTPLAKIKEEGKSKNMEEAFKRPSQPELVARLEKITRSDVVNEYLLFKDPNFDVEEDWYTPYQHHFESTTTSGSDEEFALWLAAKDLKQEEKLKKNLEKMKEAELMGNSLGADFSDLSLVNRNSTRKTKRCAVARFIK